MAKKKIPLSFKPEITDSVLIRKIQQLENEKEALTLELRKYKHKSSGKIAYVLLLFGAITLVSSILYSSSILVLTGMALAFWGALLLYIKPVAYIKASLLYSTAIPSLKAIHQIISELNYKGKGIYPPPRYLTELKGGKVFIPMKKETTLPSSEKTNEEKVFLKKPKGMYFTPSGLGLVNLFETELGTDFTRTDLHYLQQNLPKLLVEDLEIAKDFEMKIEDNMIQAKITDSIYREFYNTKELSNICSTMGCPLCSSIAIALTRVTGKPVTIENTEATKDGKIIKANFRLLETIRSEEQTEALVAESIELQRRSVFPGRAGFRSTVFGLILTNLASFFMIVLGSIILAWVGWLTWYDITVWGKDVALIFFGIRTGEAISLGIGMKVIYYFLIGLALLLFGIFTYLRRKRTGV